MSHGVPLLKSSKPPRFRRRGVILATLLASLVLSSAWFGWLALRLQPTERFVVPADVDGVRCTIQIEAFLPAAHARSAGSHPAVVLLHGVEGAARYRSAHYRTARWLADQGYAVFFVHYFDGGDYDDLWFLREDGDLDVEEIDAVCRRDAARWTGVVAESLNAIAARSDVDRTRIALDGNSLGGFVALSAAATAIHDERVADPRAVVVNWGGLFESTRPSHGFPPTLFIHGEKDTVVPLDSARHAAESVLAVESEATLFIVPGASHIARSQESDARTLQFLEKHLGAGPRVEPQTVDEETRLRAAIESSLWSMNSSLFR